LGFVKVSEYSSGKGVSLQLFLQFWERRKTSDLTASLLNSIATMVSLSFPSDKRK
jgi:hypothetical protein